MLTPGATGDIRTRVGASKQGAKLLPRPQRKYGFGEAPTEQESVPNYIKPNIQVPADFKPRAERERNFMKDTLGRLEDFRTNPKYQRARRITYGGAGSAAILAGILGTRNPEEEEQY